MPSLRARLASALIRLVVRRRRWGRDARGTARRARILFGAPAPYGWVRSVGLRMTRVREGGVRGEWVAPPDAGTGAILYVHGGGFVSCSPATHRPIAAALARAAGMRVFSAEYRLAPEHPFPAAIDDVMAAYRWLLATGVDARDVALAGDSAGGGLVLSALVRIRDEGLPPPAAAVGFSPWTDLAGAGPSIRENDGRCAMFRPSNIPEFAAAYVGPVSPADPAVSPVNADLAGLPPILLHVGSTELLLDDARRVEEKVRGAGGSCRVEVFDDVSHCWQMFAGLVPEADRSVRDAAAFIRGHLSAPGDGVDLKRKRL